MCYTHTHIIIAFSLSSSYYVTSNKSYKCKYVRTICASHRVQWSRSLKLWILKFREEKVLKGGSFLESGRTTRQKLISKLFLSFDLKII